MLSNPSVSTIETPVSSIPATSVSPIPSTSFIPASSFNSATPGNNSVLLDAFLPRSQINRTPPPSPTAPSLARRKPRFVPSFSAPRTRSNPNFVPTELVKDPARKTWARFQNLRSKIDRTPSLLERLSRFTVKTPTSQDSTPTSSKSLASLTLNHGGSSPISFSEPSSVIREKSPRPPQQEAGRTVGHVDSQIDSDSVQTKEFQIPSAVDANQHHEAGRSHKCSSSVYPSAANSGPSIHVDGATDGGNNSAHIFQQRDPSAPNQEISRYLQVFLTDLEHLIQFLSQLEPIVVFNHIRQPIRTLIERLLRQSLFTDYLKERLLTLRIQLQDLLAKNYLPLAQMSNRCEQSNRHSRPPPL